MATPLLGTFRCPCYPMDRAIIMICDMQYVIGRANALCDVNTLWAARMRYANTLWATPNPTIITRNWKGQCDDCQVSLCWSDGAWIPHFVNTCGMLPLTYNATTSSLWTLWHPVVSITFWLSTICTEGTTHPAGHKLNRGQTQETSTWAIRVVSILRGRNHGITADTRVTIHRFYRRTQECFASHFTSFT